MMTNLRPKPCNLSPATPNLRSTLALETPAQISTDLAGSDR